MATYDENDPADIAALDRAVSAAVELDQDRRTYARMVLIRSRYFPPGQAAGAAALATRLQAEYGLPGPRVAHDFAGREFGVKTDDYRLSAFPSFEGGWWVELSRRGPEK